MPRWRKQDVDAFLQALPPTLKQPIEQLRLIQKKCDTLKEEYDRELKALNARYKKLYDPVYDTRAKLVKGRGNGDVFAVPGFWLKVFLSSETVGSTISKQDEAILKFLTDVRYEPLEAGKSGFHLLFQFAESTPFFPQRELKKTYLLSDDDESLLLAAKGCTVDWAPNRNPRYKSVWKRGKQTLVETESFFDFFEPPELPMSDDGSEDLEMDQIHQLQEALEEDFDIGVVIRDVLIPNAVSWFTGEIVEEVVSDDESSEMLGSDGTAEE